MLTQPHGTPGNLREPQEYLKYIRRLNNYTTEERYISRKKMKLIHFLNQVSIM